MDLLYKLFHEYSWVRTKINSRSAFTFILCLHVKWTKTLMVCSLTLQTYHVDFTLKRCGNGRFHVVSTWNPRGVFVGKDSEASLLSKVIYSDIWDKVFKSRLSEFCWRHPLKNFISPFLNTLSHIPAHLHKNLLY